MKWKPIPTTDDDTGEAYLESTTVARNQIMDAIEREGEDAAPQVVESTLDTILSKRVLEVLGTWSKQKTQLEDMFIDDFFIEDIVKNIMEPTRQKDHRYLYSVSTEGRCLEERHRGNPYGFIKIEKPIPNKDQDGNIKLYTYDELVSNWREIFVLDKKMEKDVELREKYAPICDKHKKGNAVSALILTIQHQLKIVDPDRILDADMGYVKGTDIAFSRIKSDVAYIGKLVEYLTNRRVNRDLQEIVNGHLFETSESVNDYLAALLRVHEKYGGTDRWVKALTLMAYAAGGIHENLDDVIKLRGYSQKEADAQRKLLEKNRFTKSLVNRSDLEFIPAPLPEGKTGKFADIWLPYNGNKVSWQVYHDLGKDSYTDIQGDQKSLHIKYKTDREERMLKYFTVWHWGIMRRLAPFFISDYHKGPMEKIYQPYLSLDVFRKKA